MKQMYFGNFSWNNNEICKFDSQISKLNVSNWIAFNFGIFVCWN